MHDGVEERRENGGKGVNPKKQINNNSFYFGFLCFIMTLWRNKTDHASRWQYRTGQPHKHESQLRTATTPPTHHVAVWLLSSSHLFFVVFVECTSRLDRSHKTLSLKYFNDRWDQLTVICETHRHSKPKRQHVNSTRIYLCFIWEGYLLTS
jgi:hypothetical protein